MFPGAYVETSVSGQGIHVVGTGAVPVHGCKNSTLGLEFYHADRFMAYTGQGFGDPNTDCSAVLPFLIDTYFPSKNTADASPGALWNDFPDQRWAGLEDDDALLKKALGATSAKSVFGGKASFSDLWNNNVDVLSKTYPSLNTVDPYDRSSADAALAQLLAFWTGNHHVRMERLMRASALVRPKWDDHRTYLRNTISNAVGRQTEFHVIRSKKPPQNQAPSETNATGYQFLSTQAQLQYFAGCTYVQNVHKILVPNGTFLKPDQFKVMYAGKTFALDNMNEKVTTNAWQAFTENQGQVFPKAIGTCFKPSLPFGQMIVHDDLTLVNCYRRINVLRKAGDVSRFTEYLSRLLPNDRDREILLSYLAALVQYQGTKFQWCPIIQGTPGNAKSLIAEVVSNCIGRQYVHFPNSGDLAGNGLKFNAWMLNKCLIVIEEIYIDRREISEPLKVFITNRWMEIQGKGQDQYSAEVVGNFLMFTNHKDAMQVTFDNRRYCVFYTAQQSVEDIIRDGMGGDYFPRMYEWIRSDEGMAALNEFLYTYPIAEEFNPATTCHRAPQTTSTAEAVDLTMGTVEHEILEAIGAEKPGFRAGWISSVALEELLFQTRLASKVPINKRRGILQRLGYDWHPALRDGRLNVSIPIEKGSKPKLFIRKSHIHASLRDPANVAKCYMEAQGYIQPSEMPNGQSKFGS